MGLSGEGENRLSLSVRFLMLHALVNPEHLIPNHGRHKIFFECPILIIIFSQRKYTHFRSRLQGLTKLKFGTGRDLAEKQDVNLPLKMNECSSKRKKIVQLRQMFKSMHKTFSITDLAIGGLSTFTSLDRADIDHQYLIAVAQEVYSYNLGILIMELENYFDAYIYLPFIRSVNTYPSAFFLQFWRNQPNVKESLTKMANVDYDAIRKQHDELSKQVGKLKDIMKRIYSV